QWWNGCSVLSPVCRACLPPSLVDHLNELDPSVGGSGPHGLTARISAFVLRSASIASRPTSGDDRPKRPRVEAGRCGYTSVSDFRKDKYFSRRSWTSRAISGGTKCFARRVAAATPIRAGFPRYLRAIEGNGWEDERLAI